MIEKCATLGRTQPWDVSARLSRIHRADLHGEKNMPIQLGPILNTGAVLPISSRQACCARACIKAMLKKITTDQLRLGMHVHEVCGSWMEHPFWKSSFRL